MRRTILLIGAVFLAGCKLVPNPTGLDFGTVYVGETAGPLTAAWVNQADRNGQLLGLSTQQPYAIVNAAAFNNLSDIPPQGSSPQAQVRFSPTTAGTFNEEVRPVSMTVSSHLLALRGVAVWSRNAGAFALQNNPLNIVGSFDFSSYPIQPNQPIDWGTKSLGAPATESIFRVTNTGPAINGTATARFLKGNQNFAIVAPQPAANFNIHPVGGTGGSREIRVSFTPAALGDWLDIVEVTDSANPNNKAGIVLKARVVAGE